MFYVLFTFITIDNNQTDRLYRYPGFAQGYKNKLNDYNITTFWEWGGGWEMYNDQNNVSE